MNDYGMCKCGHSWEDHHVSYFANGYVLIEECEFYGCNEMGGYGPDGEDHCHHFEKAI